VANATRQKPVHQRRSAEKCVFDSLLGLNRPAIGEIAYFVALQSV
jgi:hypothetical protein